MDGAGEVLENIPDPVSMVEVEGIGCQRWDGCDAVLGSW